MAGTLGLGPEKAEASAAPVGLLPRMEAHVAAEVRLLREARCAVGAGEGPLTRVGPHVPLEVGALGKGTGAQMAPEGALARVGAQVRRHA